MTRLPRALLPVLVGVLAFVAFLPALDGEFLDWDDDRNFLWTTGYRGLGLRELQWMFTATWMGHYIPITWLTFGLNHALGGMEPWGYHLGNLLLHAANTTLFFFVARRLLAVAATGRRRNRRPGRRHRRPAVGPSPFGRSRRVDHGASRPALRLLLPARGARLPPGRPRSTPSAGDGSRHLSRPSRRPSARKPSR
jgi:hypothetical protein